MTKPLRLSETIPTNGYTLVSYFCYKNQKFITEKRANVPEFRRKVDAELLRYKAMEYRAMCKDYVANKQFRSINAAEALELLNLCIRGLSAEGDSGEQLRKVQPWSRDMLFTCSGYMVLALEELNPVPCPLVPHDLTPIHDALLNLAKQGEKRYETVIYDDCQN